MTHHLWELIRQRTEIMVELALQKHTNATEMAENPRRVTELQEKLNALDHLITHTVSAIEAKHGLVAEQAAHANSHLRHY